MNVAASWSSCLWVPLVSGAGVMVDCVEEGQQVDGHETSKARVHMDGKHKRLRLCHACRVRQDLYPSLSRLIAVTVRKLVHLMD